MRLLLIFSSAFILCGCQSSQHAILGAYFSGIECIGERCPVYDCEYCDPDSKRRLSSIHIEGEPRIHPLCKPDCEYCAQIRRVYQQGENTTLAKKEKSPSEKLARFEKEMTLSRDVERFLSDTMPQVKKSRNKLAVLYFKTKKSANTMLKAADDTKNAEAKLLCQNKSNDLLNKCVAISEKYSKINDKIESVYATYSISALNENVSSSIDRLSKQLLSDIEFVEDEALK